MAEFRAGKSVDTLHLHHQILCQQTLLQIAGPIHGQSGSETCVIEVVRKLIDALLGNEGKDVVIWTDVGSCEGVQEVNSND